MNPRTFLRFVENALATVMDRWERPPTAAQLALAERLKSDLAALLAAQQAGEGSAFWTGICADLHRLATEADPLFFMRWPSIGATMVHGATLGTYQTWWRLRRSADWRRVWRPALRHKQFGHPPPFPPMLSTNAMAIEHAAHLVRYRQDTGSDFHAADAIIEFGGGFGSMCRLVRALGFRGTYIIFDLPPILALQRFYLGMHGIAADGTGREAVWLCPDLDLIRQRVAGMQSERVSLISTWDLSEMPLAVRDRVTPLFGSEACAKVLMAYQPSFEGNDNRRYFSDLVAGTADRWTWRQTPVDRPDRPPSSRDSLYVFGVRR